MYTLNIVIVITLCGFFVHYVRSVRDNFFFFFFYELFHFILFKYVRHPSVMKRKLISKCNYYAKILIAFLNFN